MDVMDIAGILPEGNAEVYIGSSVAVTVLYCRVCTSSARVLMSLGLLENGEKLCCIAITHN